MKTKTILLAICMLTFAFKATSQCILDRSGWGSPVFIDDFTYTPGDDLTQLDALWYRSLPPTWTEGGEIVKSLNDENQLYYPDQFYLDGTHLRIKAERLDAYEPYNGKNYWYHSGAITAKAAPPQPDCYGSTKGFQYGLFEIVCKMPEGTTYGMWPAFWLHGGGDEIDVFELHTSAMHESDAFSNNVHNNGTECAAGFIHIPDDLDINFHTYSAVWIPPMGGDPAKVTFFFDDRELRTIDINTPDYICYADLIVNLAVENFATESSEFVVDEVRVYQKTDYTLPYKTEYAYADVPLDYTFNDLWNISSDVDSKISIGASSKLIYRGIEDKMNQFKWDGATNAWVHSWIGGKLADAAFNIDGEIDFGDDTHIFYRGVDGYIHIWDKTSGVWEHSWIESNAAPANTKVKNKGRAISATAGNRVYFRGTDNKIRKYDFNGTEWVATVLGKDAFAAAHEAVGDIAAYNENYIFYRGTDGYIQYYYFGGTHWSHFWIEGPAAPVSTKCSSEIGSLAVADDGTIFYRGSNNKLQMYQLIDGVWTHSTITSAGAPADELLAGSITAFSNNKVYYKAADGYIRGYELIDGLWQNISLANYWLYNSKPFGDIAVNSSDQLFYRNIDAHMFNRYWAVCENYNPTCLGVGDCYPFCNDIYREQVENEPNNIDIFPNPASSELNITNDNYNQPVYCKIYNTSGVIMNQFELQSGQKTIDVSVWPVGLYIVEIDLMGKISYHKIVIQ